MTSLLQTGVCHYFKLVRSGRNSHNWDNYRIIGNKVKCINSSGFISYCQCRSMTDLLSIPRQPDSLLANPGTFTCFFFPKKTDHLLHFLDIFTIFLSSSLSPGKLQLPAGAKSPGTGNPLDTNCQGSSCTHQSGPAPTTARMQERHQWKRRNKSWQERNSCKKR